MTLDKWILDVIKKSSEGGYYDEITHVISSLNEPEMKVVQNNITTSTCGIRPL